MATTVFTILILMVFILCIAIGAVTAYEDKARKIAIYSGSFDPLHIGHKAILEEITKKFDWVYLMVTPQNPLKDRKSSDVNERINSAHNALLRNELFNVTVSSIEREMLPPYYTIRTLDELKKQTPINEITLIIGADNLQNIREWKDYKRILLEYGVLVFPRGDFGIKKLNELKEELLKENSEYMIEINNTLIPNVSSTEIRNALEKGDSEVNKLLM
jgi:nicotinate-nucleotide adenylyltransferase